MEEMKSTFAKTCSEGQVIDWKDLEFVTDKDERIVYYSKGKKELLNGVYRIRRGLDIEVLPLKQGLVNGRYRRLRDGVVREEGSYENGLREGLFVEYYQDGYTHRREAPMKNGKIEGMVVTYYNNGEKETEKEYHHSIEHGVERRYSFLTGEIMIEGQWKNGFKEGRWIEKFEEEFDMIGETTMYYVCGKLDGPYITKHTQGGKILSTTKGQYSNGMKKGLWRIVDAKNKIISEWNE